MLTFNGKSYNLKTTSWANLFDLSTRMFQFFNYYIKGKPEPGWMKKGIPVIEKGDNLDY